MYGPGTDPDAFFTGAAHALVKGLRQAGVDRLVTVGVSAIALLDEAETPQHHRGHLAVA